MGKHQGVVIKTMSHLKYLTFHGNIYSRTQLLPHNLQISTKRLIKNQNSMVVCASLGIIFLIGLVNHKTSGSRVRKTTVSLDAHKLYMRPYVPTQNIHEQEGPLTSERQLEYKYIFEKLKQCW